MTFYFYSKISVAGLAFFIVMGPQNSVFDFFNGDGDLESILRWKSSCSQRQILMHLDNISGYSFVLLG